MSFSSSTICEFCSQRNEFQSFSPRHVRGENTKTQPPGAAFTSEPISLVVGETAEAPPVAEKARLFRGSGGIGGHKSGRESQCRNGGHLKGELVPP